ncbi:MAG: ferredoxin--NADP reductase [Gammaproteobacteria bacterium]|nr:ferredoxin--NADP reductase [Gammaproteobacteria bacterium]
MAEAHTETVTEVHHWSDTLFTIKTTRAPGMRFRNGEFAMIGIEVDGKPLMRAYSMASSHYEDHLEFYSIKVQDGALTSRLQHIQVGDKLLVSRKPTGTLLWDHLRPGKRLYLLSTGTGLAPFLSVIKDPDIYEHFETVILVHGCRFINELTYQKLITSELQSNQYFGDSVREKLIYYPAVTREPFRNYGRITELIQSGKLMRDIGLPPFHVEDDRFMLCGSPGMLKSLSAILDARGFRETRKSDHREYVVERAFVEK